MIKKLIGNNNIKELLKYLFSLDNNSLQELKNSITYQELKDLNRLFIENDLYSELIDLENRGLIAIDKATKLDIAVSLDKYLLVAGILKESPELSEMKAIKKGLSMDSLLNIAILSRNLELLNYCLPKSNNEAIKNEFLELLIWARDENDNYELFNKIIKVAPEKAISESLSVIYVYFPEKTAEIIRNLKSLNTFYAVDILGLTVLEGFYSGKVITIKDKGSKEKPENSKKSLIRDLIDIVLESQEPEYIATTLIISERMDSCDRNYILDNIPEALSESILLIYSKSNPERNVEEIKKCLLDKSLNYALSNKHNISRGIKI